MKSLLTILMIITLSLIFNACKSDSVEKTVTPSPVENTYRGNEQEREATATCEDVKIESNVYIQGDSQIDTIYEYQIINEQTRIKAFPNWYTFNKLRDENTKIEIVPDQCIVDILNDSATTRLTPYSNLARIRVLASYDDSGDGYINGSHIYESGVKKLNTGDFEVTFTTGKNVIAFKTSNSKGFGGVAARIHVDDCGEIVNGKCDGTGYEFFTSKPYQINYSLASNSQSGYYGYRTSYWNNYGVSGCTGLYMTNFNAASVWGLSTNPSSTWYKSTSMQSFTYVPDSYEQDTNLGYGASTGTLEGYPEAQWLSSGINHPYCGAEGMDWGTFSGEDGKLYYKTIITCDYFWCWQDNEDTVSSKLFIP